MPETPPEFYARVTAAASDGLLPAPDLSGWTDIFPFDPDGLRLTPLLPPAPEKPRGGADGVDCHACQPNAPAVWSDGNWRLSLLSGFGLLTLMLQPQEHCDLATVTDQRAAQLGILTVHITRAIEGLPHIARGHVVRWGDGGEHLHLWFFARPAEQLQLRGSHMVTWAELLPELPPELAAADARSIAVALAASYGGSAS